MDKRKNNQDGLDRKNLYERVYIRALQNFFNYNNNYHFICICIDFFGRIFEKVNLRNIRLLNKKILNNFKFLK